MINTCTSIFGKLADAYVIVHNLIPDDHTHLFTVTSVGSTLDLLPMLAIFQSHNVMPDQFVVESTQNGVSVAVTVRIDTEPSRTT